MERKIGLFSVRAFSNASLPQGYQSTGLCACCNRYGLFSFASLLVMPVQDSTAKISRNLFTRVHIPSLPMFIAVSGDLVTRLKARDKSALEDLLHEHGGRLY